MRQHVVLRDAFAGGIHEPEAELRQGQPLLGSEPKPAHGLRMVLRDACAEGIPDPEVVLRVGVALLSQRPLRVDLRRLRLHRHTQC